MFFTNRAFGCLGLAGDSRRPIKIHGAMIIDPDLLDDGFVSRRVFSKRVSSALVLEPTGLTVCGDERPLSQVGRRLNCGCGLPGDHGFRLEMTPGAVPCIATNGAVARSLSSNESNLSSSQWVKSIERVDNGSVDRFNKQRRAEILAHDSRHANRMRSSGVQIERALQVIRRILNRGLREELSTQAAQSAVQKRKKSKKMPVTVAGPK